MTRKLPPHKLPIELLIFLPLFFLAFAARAWHLSWIPGINGDEAWYGRVANDLVHERGIPSRTPNGNILNWFFLGPHVVLAEIFSPSFTVLRLPALFTGLLTIVTAGIIGRRILGAFEGWICAALVSALPIAIAYSRMSWDASQSLLFCLVFLLTCWERRFWLCPLAFAAAALVHPTNILVLPAGAVFLIGRSDRGTFAKTAGALLALAVIVTAVALRASRSGGAFEVFHPKFSLDYFFVLGGFLFGPVALEYFTGIHENTALIAFSCVGVITFLFTVALSLIRGRDNDRRVILLAFLIEIVFAMLTVGAQAMLPHAERYGIFILAPAILAAAASMGALVPMERRRTALIGTSIACSAWTLAFAMPFFDAFLKDGATQAHRAFRSSDPEPKARAYAELLRCCAREELVPVFAEDYWLTLPLSYLDSAQQHFTWKEAKEAAHVTVVFSESELDRKLRGTVSAETISRNPLITIYRY